MARRRSKFVVTIETENAAFDGEYREQEIARILREAAHRVETNPTLVMGILRDANGNQVGRWEKH